MPQDNPKQGETWQDDRFGDVIVVGGVSDNGFVYRTGDSGYGYPPLSKHIFCRRYRFVSGAPQ